MMITLQELSLLITDGKHGDCENEDCSGFYFVSCKDVKDGKIDYSGARQITETDFLDTHRRTQLEANDIVITNSGTIGRMALVADAPETYRTTFQKSVAIVKPNQEKVVPQWLYYSIMANCEVLITWAGGTAQKNLLLKDIRAFSIEVPSLPTQRKIAAVLSAYDNLIENNTRRMRILEEMAQAIYREWFVKFRFPGHEGVRLVDSGTELGEVPEGWTVQPFSDLVVIDPKHTVDRYSKKPYIGMNALSMKSMLIDLDLVEMKVGNSGAKFRNRDVLFPRITPSVENGKAGFVQLLEEDQVAIGSTEIIVFREKVLNAEYIYFLSREHDFRGNAINSMVGASGRQRVQPGCFNIYQVAKPPKELLDKFSQVVAPMFETIHTLSKSNANLATTRDLLLPKLVSGEVDVAELPVDSGG